jgi:hypothetical protein
MDKNKLLSQKHDSVPFELEGLGEVQVRPLTRKQIHICQAQSDTLEFEARAVSFALADPELTFDEVKAWMDVAIAGLFEPLIEKIQEISGLKAGADKSRVPSTRKR